MAVITEADLGAFAPKARKEYVVALLGGMDHLRAAGVLESPLRLCHFMAQVGHETGGFTVLRESLTYTSAKRLRQVWPARFRDKSDAELSKLVKNPVALGDAVYMGRMDNNRPGDGYAYRGGGFLQTTGKAAVARYAAALKMEPKPELLDDVALTLRFACIEWKEARCCEWADENDIVKVSKAINTGSAGSKVKPVGMQDREAWFAKAWAVWGEKGKPDTPPVKPASAPETVAKVGVPVAVGVEVTRQVVTAPPDLTVLSNWKGFGDQIGSLLSWASSNPGTAVICVAVFLGVTLGLPLLRRS